MQIDCSKLITRPNGQLVEDGDAPSADGRRPAMTIASAIVTALSIDYGQRETIDGKEKYRRDKLARKIVGADGPVEISIEEAATIKTVVGLCYPPFVVGPVFDALESAATPLTAVS